MANAKWNEDNTVTVILGPFESAKEYPESSTGKSQMVDNTGGFLLLPCPNFPGEVFKIDCKLIKIIPKKQRKSKEEE